MPDTVIPMTIDLGPVQAGARVIIRSLADIVRAAEDAARDAERLGGTLRQLEAAGRSNAGDFKDIPARVVWNSGSLVSQLDGASPSFLTRTKQEYLGL